MAQYRVSALEKRPPQQPKTKKSLPPPPVKLARPLLYFHGVLVPTAFVRYISCRRPLPFHHILTTPTTVNTDQTLKTVNTHNRRSHVLRVCAFVRLRRLGRHRRRHCRRAATARGRRLHWIRHGPVVRAGRLFLRRRGRHGHGVPQVQSSDGAGQGPRQARPDRRGRSDADRPGRQVSAGHGPASRPGRPGRPGRRPGRRQQERPAGRHAGQPHGQAHVDQDHRVGRSRRSRRSWQEEGQGHATGHDDGRHDGRRRHGPDGVEDHRPDGRQGAVGEQNRAASVRYHSAQETVPASAVERRRRRRTRAHRRVGSVRPPLRPQHRRPPRGLLGPSPIADNVVAS